MALLLLSSCEEDSKRVEDYRIDFATVLTFGTSYKFQLDNRKTLIPSNPENRSEKNGQRVLLNYVPLKGDTIKVRKATPIFTDSIKTEGFPEKWEQESVKIQSLWVAGDYLNMSLEVEYHSKPHRIALLKDSSSSSVDLYFSHSRGDDPPGYRHIMYASFYIADIKSSTTTPFRVFINTYNGLREFHFEL